MKAILLLLLLLFTWSSGAFANGFSVGNVKVNCASDKKCSYLISIFKKLSRSYVDEDHFRKILKVYVENEGIVHFSYSLTKNRDRYDMSIDIVAKELIQKIKEVRFIGKYKITLPTILPIKEDDYFNENRLLQTKSLLKSLALDKGFPSAEVEIDKKLTSKGYTLATKINLGEPIKVSKLNVISDSKFLKKYLVNVLGQYQKRVLDLQKIKAEIEDAKEAFVQYGYYLADIELRVKPLSKYKSILFVEVRNTEFYTFYLEEHDELSMTELKLFLIDSTLSYRRDLGVEGIKKAVKEYVESFGYQGGKISIKRSEIINTKKEKGFYYFINVKRGEQLRLSEINFKGNDFLDDKAIRKIFYKMGTDQVRSNIFSRKYYDNFSNILKTEYIKHGFVSVAIDKPTIIFEKKTNNIHINYRIREGVRTKIANININGPTRKEANKLRAIMENKFEKAFNPIAFESDLDKIKNYLYNKGYFFAEIKNLNTKNIVRYSRDLSQVSINIDIGTGEKLRLGKTIIIGSKSTRSRLIRRELAMPVGTLITKRKVERAQSSLLSLGIFSQVQIRPVGGESNKTDLLVYVKEKDFGTIEVAPGIRSDLGLKLSTVINYNNIDGLNKRITFRGSVNRRLNLNTIESSRRSIERNLTEFNTNISFAENYILKSNLNFRSSIGLARQRFFSFDADIRRFSTGVSSRFNRWLSWQADYQLESIAGYNTVPDINGDDPNNAEFQIGSITPGVKLDFRDSPIGTKKGSVFDFSVEFANPAFGSQDSDDLKIDYYKAISRNKFYYPVSSNVVLAFSASMGLQENLAKESGYIPGIKVFRLSGADIIRGYEDDEMNRILQTNDDISQFEVNNKAYMASFKLEPRFYYTDNLILGLFYDAGRVFVDRFELDELRSSVGVSFKYLTPVGTLDFDYGIKLLRKEDSSGNLDSPGRIHVSIGFF